jgi:hypothetical protein
MQVTRSRGVAEWDFSLTEAQRHRGPKPRSGFLSDKLVVPPGILNKARLRRGHNPLCRCASVSAPKTSVSSRLRVKPLGQTP